MKRTARIATAVSAPIIGSLAFLGFAVAPATPAAAANPITITSNNITVIIPPVVYLSINY
jgi:hypothetical protein